MKQVKENMMGGNEKELLTHAQSVLKRTKENNARKEFVRIPILKGYKEIEKEKYRKMTEKMKNGS